MKNFHDYYFGLDSAQRSELAKKAGTSIHYLERIAGAFALPSFRMAKKLVDASGKKISFESLIATWEKKHGAL